MNFEEGSADQVNSDALGRLVRRAEETNSSALVVVKDGALIGEWNFAESQEPIEAMSATKSVVNVAIGRLLNEGLIPSIDHPVSELYPEWKQGRKRQITIRHLLNHTSGIQNLPTTMEEIYPAPDFVKLALAAEVNWDPGTRFTYNNKAVNLLAGIVQVASGKRMDAYLGEEVFAPLGISEFTWTLDPAGNPHAMSGLQIKPIDFAKIGQMMLDGGRGLLHGSWIEESIRPAQPFNPTCGLLWWIDYEHLEVAVTERTIQNLHEIGMPERAVGRLAALVGRQFDRGEVFSAVREAVGGKDDFTAWQQHAFEKGAQVFEYSTGTPVGYSARGFLGQYLQVLPAHNLVAVRQIYGKRYKAEVADFGDFFELVRALVEPTASLAS